jgi:glycosyltransferase involved in cell wall biosynthesis
MQHYNITHLNSYFISSPLHAELVSALDKAGLAQKVFVPVQRATHIGKNKPEELLNSEVIYDHCFNTADRYLWPMKMYKIWSSFQKHFQNSHPHFIHAHSLIANGLIAYWAFKRWGTPYMVSVRYTDVHVFMERSWWFRKTGIKILEHAQAIMLLSPSYKDVQLKHFFSEKAYEAIADKSFIIPNGINDFWIENRKLKEKQSEIPTVIFVGNVGKRKNLSTLIRACDILYKEGFNLKLIVVGDGPLLNAAKSKPHQSWIDFHGRVASRDILLQLYRQADILVVPSLIETFGLVYPEAMSQGLPVIYTRDQGFDGFFPDGQVGYAVNPHSPQDIAEKIEQVFSDYERISANAFEASKNFSWNVVTEKLIQLYQSIHQ